MILKDIIEKSIIRGERLSEEERITLLDFFMRAETAATNPATGAIANPSQSDITAMVEQAMLANARQFFPRVSDITNHIGLQAAGEFRVGNGQAPGDGFTGGRFGWPGFNYDDVEYILAGVENDVLQVGIALVDGRFYAGGGAVVLDDTGIVAVGGTIGGWTIGLDYIRDTAGMVGMSSAVTGGDDIRFWAGDTTPDNAPFQVSESGELVANNADITGNISATTGLIGGWEVNDPLIHRVVANLGIRLDSSTQTIRLGNMAGHHIVLDGANEHIQSSNYLPGAAGFNIDTDTGDAEFGNITARGELKTFLLTSSNQMAVAGNIIVSKDAGKLGADVASGDTTVNFGKALTVGNWIKIQGPDSAGTNALEWMLIGSLVSGTTYNVTRNVDGSGANDWLKDTPFVVIGANGDSRIELAAGASGSIQLITQGASWNTQTVQASMSTTAGAITAGAGNVLINASGVTMANSATSWFNFKDSAGNSGVINIAADPSNDLEITNIATAGTPGTISTFLKNTAGNTRRATHQNRHPTIANFIQFSFDANTDMGGRVLYGSDHFIDYVVSGGTGTADVRFNYSSRNIDFLIGSDTNTTFFWLDASAETLSIDGAVVINDSGADRDFRVESDTNASFLFLDASAESFSIDGAVSINASGADRDLVVAGDTNPYVFIVDAGNDRVEICRNDGGRTTVHILNPTGTTYFNETNYDIDFKVEGDTDGDLFWVDAGLDAIGIGGAAQSGYKLKVTGKVNLASGNTYDINDVAVLNGSTSGAAAETNANDIFAVTSPGGTSAFVGTINGAPSGTSVTYNVTSGTEGSMVPSSTSQLAKMRLYNTTRGNSALISNCNTTTNVITLTASAPGTWANGDTITIASQTVSGGGFAWVDLELTSGPTGKAALFVNTVINSATVGNAMRIHPFDASFSLSKNIVNIADVASQNTNGFGLVKLTTNLISLSWTGTPVTVAIREAGYLL